MVECPACGGVADDEHTSAIPFAGEIGEKSCYAINYLAVALAVGVRIVDVERTARLQLCDRHAVPLAVVAFAQASVGNKCGFRSGEGDLGGFHGAAEIGGEDDGDAVARVALAQPSSMAKCLPRSDRRPSSQPVAIPRPLSSLHECVSKMISVLTLPLPVPFSSGAPLASV